MKTKLKVIKKKIRRRLSKKTDNHYIFVYKGMAIDSDNLS